MVAGGSSISSSCHLTASHHRHVMVSYVAERLHAPSRVPADMVQLLFEDGIMDVHRLLLVSHSDFLR